MQFQYRSGTILAGASRLLHGGRIMGLRIGVGSRVRSTIENGDNVP